jgi:drug/metabolite transporter (DMT)-like permease
MEKGSSGSKGWLGHLSCFLAYAIFGINIIVCKDLTATADISPVALFCIRSIGAGALFWLIGLLMPRERVARRDLPQIMLASILGFFMTQVAFLYAIPKITPTDCSIMSSLSPIYTMFIAAVALREPITFKKAAGVAVSFLGIVYLILTSASGDGGRVTSLSGILLMIVNAVSFSLYLGVFKPVIMRYSVVTFMKWVFLFAIVISLPLAISEIAEIDFMSLSPRNAAEMAFLVVMATFVCYFLIPLGQKIIRPTLVSLYSYVQPIIAIVVSISLGMEALTWQKALAAAMVFGGVLMVSRSRSAAGR